MFQKININSLEKIEYLLKQRNTFSCEHTLLNLAVWGEEFDMHYYLDDDMLIIRVLEKNGFVFSVPFSNDLSKSVMLVKEYCDKNNILPIFWFEEGESLNEFQKITNEEYEPCLLRGNCEYIYLRENLANLSGKKYHSKRNHISSFSKKYNWCYEDITDENTDEILEIAQQWSDEKFNDKSINSEIEGIKLMLENIEKFDIRGGLIRVEGQAVAFCLGTPINSEVFDINVEKALPEFAGAYPVINNEFAKRLNSKYINREDDLGIEGLRKAKLSYKPEFLLNKYLCIPKNLLKMSADLHKETFGDNGEFTEKLVSNFFAENCFYVFENREIVSQMFVLDCQLEGEKCGYIYAAATTASERNKGHMKNLIEMAKRYYPRLCLKPANESLYAFYEKFGFQTAFYTNNSFEKPTDFLKVRYQEIKNIEEYKNIKSSFGRQNALNLGDKALELIFDEYHIITSKDDSMEFLATFCIENNILKIKELFCKSNPNNLIATLIDNFGCCSCILDMNYGKCDVKSGMIYPKTQNKFYLGNAID